MNVARPVLLVTSLRLLALLHGSPRIVILTFDMAHGLRYDSVVPVERAYHMSKMGRHVLELQLAEATRLEYSDDRHIPMPKRTKIPDLPLTEMEVGDSFKAPINAGDATEVRALRQRISRWQRNSTSRFSCIRDTDGETGEAIMRVFKVS